jgi:hypothetical protein
MAKDVGKAIAQSEKAKTVPAAQNSGSRSLSVGFKKQFTSQEQVEIKAKRREMRERLVAAG